MPGEQKHDDIASALLEARKRTGLSQWQFAIKHGLNPGSYPAWEQGRYHPDLYVALGLMKALGCEGLKKLGIKEEDLRGLVKERRCA